MKNIESIPLPSNFLALVEKAKKYKDPTYYCKNKDGGVYFKTSYGEMLNDIQNKRKRPDDYWTEEKINDNLLKYDVYGTKKPVSIESQLNKSFDSPKKVPVELYKYISEHFSIITSDASDAVRWSRIINTKKSERYPDEGIVVFRAVEKQFHEIREGDWVTTQEQYAILHNQKYLEEKGHVIQMKINGKDLLHSPTGNWEEAIYAPLNYSIDIKF